MPCVSVTNAVEYIEPVRVGPPRPALTESSLLVRQTQSADQIIQSSWRSGNAGEGREYRKAGAR
jgi:hypothetical protein